MMRRIPMTLAAAALALGAGVAQGADDHDPEHHADHRHGQPGLGHGTSQAAPMPAGSVPLTAPRPHAAPGHHGGAMPGAAGSASTYGMSG